MCRQPRGKYGFVADGNVKWKLREVKLGDSPRKAHVSVTNWLISLCVILYIVCENEDEI